MSISNPSNVIETDKEILPLTFSETLCNHKATLVDYERNLIAFYGYGYDGTEFFVYRFENERFYKSAHIKFKDVYENVRGIYIGDEFYIVTDDMLLVYNLEKFNEINRVNF